MEERPGRTEGMLGHFERIPMPEEHLEEPAWSAGTRWEGP